MRIRTRYRIFGVIALVMLCGLLWLGWRIYEAAPKEVTRTYIDISPAEARDLTAFPIPDSATDINLAAWSHFRAYLCIMRFRLPAAEIEPFLEEFVNPHGFPYEAIEASTEQTGTGPIVAPWFAPDSIVNGKGVRVRSNLFLWVDYENGWIYLRESD